VSKQKYAWMVKSDMHPNDGFTVVTEGKSAKEAFKVALHELGWWVSQPYPYEGEPDGTAKTDGTAGSDPYVVGHSHNTFDAP
jgi:hypothetical protein